MSQENVEAVRRAYGAWNADDLDAFLAELDPEVEWHPSIEPALEAGKPPIGALTGAKGLRRLSRRGMGTSHMRIQETRDLGESVVVLGHADLTARTTGLEFTEEVGSLGTFRGGRIATGA